ncbi:DUF817 domain-containing protein [Microbulbifer sp. YPW16]|uniref:DUF817 domain-containing protein n=1 Tax=Microbulbifer sp. YPW16 TaxID=2904242 RepID=UPI001E36CE22|nr:DUF817 domain-containing protein [Microbulbifer sp. YPW16]UHQ56248.1 DUF817 domain-containing protein [Microbulbifer sp. YPW16]
MSLAVFIRELWLFGVKQAYACMFGGFLLLVMIVTRYWYPLESLHRYDFIFLAAVAFQLFLLLFRFETLREALVIVVFHLVATVMELFKTADAIGSWVYPEAFVFGVGNVPLFTGFMYSAVGSYIARVWRIFDFRFTDYPGHYWAVALVALIYLNFFTHHFLPDLRWLLLAITVLLFWRTRIYFRVEREHRYMPLLLGWLLVALFIWLAENIATYVNIWIYPNQSAGWNPVPLAKLSSWYLLMLLSFVLVSLVNRVRGIGARGGQPVAGAGKNGLVAPALPD